MKTRLTIGLLLLAAGLAGSVYWTLTSLASKKITVAVDAPIMNKRIFDPSDMDAARFYFEENPDSRMQIKELFYDFDPKRSPERFEAAMDDGIEFFVTTQPSSTLLASTQLFQTPSALLINTSSTNPSTTGKDDYIIRIIADARAEQQAIANYVDSLPGKRLLVLQDSANSEYTDPAFDYFIAALDGGDQWKITHEKLLFENFNPTRFQQLMSEPFDALYVLGGDFQASMGNMVQLFHQYHPNAPIVLTPWARSNAIYETAGPALDRMVLLGHHPGKAQDPAVADYLQRFTKRYGYQPMAMALMVRQGLELLEQAFAAGHTDPEAVKQYLLSQPELQTSLGTIRIDAYGDSQQALHPIEDLGTELKPAQ